jgi:hypothetical protein
MAEIFLKFMTNAKPQTQKGKKPHNFLLIVIINNTNTIANSNSYKYIKIAENQIQTEKLGKRSK